MTRITALIVAIALAASPAWAQEVSNEAPPEDAAPPPADALTDSKAAMVQSPPAPAPDPVYQVLRVGDRQMSCEALINETNSLSAGLITEQKAAAVKAKKAKVGKGIMGGAAGGLMAGAARYGLARGMMGGAISAPMAQAVVSVTDRTSIAAGQAIAESGDAAQDDITSPQEQRRDHLMELYREKAC